MSIVVSIEKVTQDYKNALDGVLLELKGILDSFPENKAIKTLGSNMFIVNFSSLQFSYKDDKGKLVQGSNWSPEFQNFRWQYQAVYDTLSKMNDKTKMADRLKGIVDDRFIMKNTWSGLHKSGGTYKVNLHPEVIDN